MHACRSDATRCNVADETQTGDIPDSITDGIRIAAQVYRAG
jgi:hypothetical protein